MELKIPTLLDKNSAEIKKLINFFKNYPLIKIKKGSILFYSDDEIRNILYLIQGKIKMYDIKNSGEEVVLNDYPPPMFIPLSIVMTGQKSQYFYEASTDVLLRVAPKKQFIDFIKSDPGVLLFITTIAFNQLIELFNRLHIFTQGSAKSRTIFEILVQNKNFEHNGLPKSIDISEADIASRAGLSRETVSRELKGLKNRGIISTGRKCLKIHKLKVLEKELISSLN